MEYAVEMGSVLMIYIASFMKISSGIRKLRCGREGFTETQTAWRSRKPKLG
jgi:hypothetical protein